jgi:hypothetical protein
MSRTLITAALAIAILSSAACAHGPFYGDRRHNDDRSHSDCAPGDRSDHCAQQRHDDH